MSHPSLGGPRVAIIHYWLVGMRGGEKVVEALCGMFPQADIFTHVVVPESLSPILRSHRIQTTRIGRLPMAPKLYQKYLPLMPRALEELDLTGYDLVLSSEAGPAKGVIPPPDAPHLCYCHSPMRYLWDQYHVYRNGAGALTRALMPPLAHRLRQWDVTSAARVDGFAANSAHVAARIRKYWRREADIVPPPVAVEEFAPVAASERGDFYLWAGELVPYKRPDLAVEAFKKLDKPLVVIGGPDETVRRLAKDAGPKTKFLGKVPFATLKDHLARCRALIFPGEEDFGIVPVEAMASGRPVIGYGRGGLLDTVVEGETGLFFRDQSVEAIIDAVERFEKSDLFDADPDGLVAHARNFDLSAFQTGIRRSLDQIGAPA
ncbi:glycosyltransferase [Jannaschia aquimarina]|uniref:MshA_2 protein n=1 Tax=Jannaschia aquimarina TaxID=935700 RepID=A0A0D1CNK8_9RHOB|nr:glycosyltransferase [Jannaschia aquimarina]KIT16297.1 D-inositol 3-phosphate glycosyltransferase [Jannaschia aquimarina]SNT26674.1 Glycosyltransferase involved in cell wall bisynthesis [Jannaschia aquimarina]